MRDENEIKLPSPAEIEKWQQEAESRRDEADKERLERRKLDSLLKTIKGIIPFEWEMDCGNWNGDVVGLPGVIASWLYRIEDEKEKQDVMLQAAIAAGGESAKLAAEKVGEKWDMDWPK